MDKMTMNRPLINLFGIEQCCSFEVAPLLPCSSNTTTLVEVAVARLHGNNMPIPATFVDVLLLFL